MVDFSNFFFNKPSSLLFIDFVASSYVGNALRDFFICFLLDSMDICEFLDSKISVSRGLLTLKDSSALLSVFKKKFKINFLFTVVSAARDIIFDFSKVLLLVKNLLQFLYGTPIPVILKKLPLAILLTFLKFFFIL